jgi:hypothetical protein
VCLSLARPPAIAVPTRVDGARCSVLRTIRWRPTGDATRTIPSSPMPRMAIGVQSQMPVLKRTLPAAVINQCPLDRTRRPTSPEAERGLERSDPRSSLGSPADVRPRSRYEVGLLPATSAYTRPEARKIRRCLALASRQSRRGLISVGGSPFWCCVRAAQTRCRAGPRRLRAG